MLNAAVSNTLFWDNLSRLRQHGSMCDVQLCVKDDMGATIAISAHKVEYMLLHHTGLDA